MNDLSEKFFVVSIILGLIIVTIILTSLPFALIGWAMLTFIGIWTTVNITYLSSIAVGFVFVLLVAILME